METSKTDTSPRRSATAMRGLRQRRKRAGMKLYEAAAAVGVSRQTFINWENGASVPGRNLLCALAALFDCTVGALFDGDEEPDLLTLTEYEEMEGGPYD